MGKKLFYEELVFLDKKYHDQAEFFRSICADLQQLGWVKSSFYQAITEREAAFSTGLETQPFSVAIPHTDAEHVEKNFIAFVRVVEPISFVHMGIPDKMVEAQMLFVLGIADASNQVKILSNMIELLSNEAMMKQLISAQDPADIVQIMNQAVSL
ncbi:PTS galactitol transporter subunit IIA [Enterococcus florum]|uniref:PTS galactitol transporter subunit IIA n=1 Tax=Enterococcus florum TaxID=2480627 RepID=A0A4P5P9U9_9ENTE|nr:PTS sugar transporter subunit IIA [Enterococcus florum]GCF93114.1 PTS galactitol transporter subunit IIA [Enterococcus florum]